MIVLLLSLLFSGGLAALFHLIWGEHPRELFWFWGLGLAGFLLGHWVGSNNPLPLPTLGELHIVPALLGGLLGVLVANSFKV